MLILPGWLSRPRGKILHPVQAEQEGREMGPCPAAAVEVGLSALPMTLNPSSIGHK